MLLSATVVAESFCAGFSPEPEISVSEWADRYRIVAKPSPEPGRWRTSRVPYLREPMDRMSLSDPCEICVVMKPAQAGGTEAGLNALACWMHSYPDSTMLVLPTITEAKKFSRIRLDKMIEATPVLRGTFVEPRSREGDNNVLLKTFGEARDSLVLAGANSGSALRSYPSRFVYADEIDGYPLDVDNEGNPIDILLARTSAYANRKIFLTSTPTVEDSSSINRWFRAGDQNEYFVPCPLCGYMQVLVFGADRVRRAERGGLRWPKGEPEAAQYECERCDEKFPEWQKVQVLGRGEWRAQAAGNGAGKIRSYHFGALICPYGWPGNSWENLAREWDRGYDKPVTRKSFVNLREGLPYADAAEVKTDADTLMGRCEAYGPEVPSGVAVLIAVADVQGDRIEVEIIGVGAGEEMWSIEYRVLRGDTARLDGVWNKELDPLLKGEWLSETGMSLSINAAAIDAGYNQATVMKFCEARKGRNIWAIKGKAGYGRLLWPTRSRRSLRGGGAAPIIVGVDTAKELVYARLRIVEPGPGCCHFLRGTMREQFEMLVSEVRVPDYSGPVPKYVWKKKKAGARNEWLDIRGYAYALLRGLEIQTAFRLDREAEKLKLMTADRALGKTAPKVAFQRRPAVSFVDDPYFL